MIPEILAAVIRVRGVDEEIGAREEVRTAKGGAQRFVFFVLCQNISILFRHLEKNFMQNLNSANIYSLLSFQTSMLLFYLQKVFSRSIYYILN